MSIANHLYLEGEDGLQGRSTRTSKQFQPIKLLKKGGRERGGEKGGNRRKLDGQKKQKTNKKEKGEEVCSKNQK